MTQQCDDTQAAVVVLHSVKKSRVVGRVHREQATILRLGPRPRSATRRCHRPQGDLPEAIDVSSDLAVRRQADGVLRLSE